VVEAKIGDMHLYGSQYLGNNQTHKKSSGIWASFHYNYVRERCSVEK
jgi:hypothetical protein